MAWSSPRTWVIEIVSAAQMNQEVRDNLRYLHGDDGDTTLLDGQRWENDGSFGAWKSGGLPIVGWASNAFVAFSTAIPAYYEANIGGTAQARITTNGLYVPSGKYLTYAGLGGTSWPLVQNHGSIKAVRWGKTNHVQSTGGANENQEVVTGLTTVTSFVFSVENSTDANQGPGNIVDVGGGGTVTVSCYHSLTGATTYIYWSAFGDL